MYIILSEVFKSCEFFIKFIGYGISIRRVEYIDGYDDYVVWVKNWYGKIILGNLMIVDECRGLDYGFDFRD